MGSFFSICCRQTGHFFCHISIPNLFFKLVTGPTSKKSVPSRDSAVCLNRHKSKSVPKCTEATLSTRYSAEAHRFAGISPFKCPRVQKQKSRVTRWMEPTRILFAVSKSFFAQMRTRLARVSGQLMNQVTFGFGLLGRIDSGTLEFERVEVGPQQWKTAFINIHFSGRAVIFKTVNKDQYERRSDFRAVSSDLSLSDARDLLITRTLPLPQTAQTSNQF